MFRKLTLAALLAAGTLTGLALTPTAAKADEFRDHGRHRRFEVLVRHRHHWDVHGVYRDRHEAERVARRLRHEGFRVEVREC